MTTDLTLWSVINYIKDKIFEVLQSYSVVVLNDLEDVSQLPIYNIRNPMRREKEARLTRQTFCSYVCNSSPKKI